MTGPYLALGEAGPDDASSKPNRSPRSTWLAKAMDRRTALKAADPSTHCPTASPRATVGRVLRRAGLSLRAALEPAEPLRSPVIGPIARGAGEKFLFVAVDDHAQIDFTAMHPDEGKGGEGQRYRLLLHAAVAYNATLGITIRRLLADHGSAFRSKAFVQTCRQPGIAKRYPA